MIKSEIIGHLPKKLSNYARYTANKPTFKSKSAALNWSRMLGIRIDSTRSLYKDLGCPK